MSGPLHHRSIGARSAAIVLLVALALAVGAGCAKVEGDDAATSRDPKITYYAAKLIPMGKTVRAALADGSITETKVPGDVVTDDELDTPTSIECLVAGRAIPSGSLLRRSMFVESSSLGLDQGLTDGTTVDEKC